MKRLLFFLTWSLVTGVAIAASRPPNIVVILADDLGCGDLSLYDGWIDTPRMDRMAAEGIKFTDFHSNSSVCSPTRAAFLSGRYQQRLGIVDVIVGGRQPDHGLLPSVPTLPRVLKDQGYATALFGKWHCGYQDRYNPVHHGFDEFVGFLKGGSDYHIHRAWRVGLERQDVPGYTTHIITDRSVDFIKRHRDEPFFLYASHAAVHNPYQTPADTPENRDPDAKRFSAGPENHKRYRIMLEELDRGIGRILDTLHEQGIAENTLVFFFSDNGAVHMRPNPRPFRGGKFSHYEGGHRVPAVAWWPGRIPAGTVSDAPLMGFDLFPTFAEAAGCTETLPDNLDGSSFLPHVLSGQPMADRDLFFGYEPKLGTALRRGPWKMIVKKDDVQLYHLDRDIKETTNVVEHHPEIATSMRAAIEHFKATVVPGS